jgi:hypothetical protein
LRKRRLKARIDALLREVLIVSRDAPTLPRPFVCQTTASSAAGPLFGVSISDGRFTFSEGPAGTPHCGTDYPTENLAPSNIDFMKLPRRLLASAPETQSGHAGNTMLASRMAAT